MDKHENSNDISSCSYFFMGCDPMNNCCLGEVRTSKMTMHPAFWWRGKQGCAFNILKGYFLGWNFERGQSIDARARRNCDW
ncbi:hypothetical protein BDZ45DRAFT_120888 [Acephala macrosclerotiorum]|nr:hypothetical protein BDZ45DRAFT_120888 [Acephala macrosclerotiorum]